MAKDLPYFKFFCSEWSDGDITLETYETQGLFINICAYYWSNECVLELSKLKKRFRNDAELVDLLIENNLLKQIDGFIKINFLDEQKFERGEQSKVKSKGGLASAEAKRLAKIQQTSNTTSTESQHVLKYCSTESQVLREDKKREDNKKVNNDLSVNWDALLNQFNSITGKHQKVVDDKVKRQVMARLKSGYTKNDIVTAITNCFKDPYHIENPKYLTLEFISRPDKMATYSQDITTPKKLTKQQERL